MPSPRVRWKNCEEPSATIVTAKVNLLDQADRMSSTTPEPGPSVTFNLDSQNSVRMLYTVIVRFGICNAFPPLFMFFATTLLDIMKLFGIYVKVAVI